MNKPFYQQILRLCLVGFLLTGCSTVMSPPQSEKIQPEQIQTASQWAVQGRIAVMNTAIHKGESASFYWHQQGKDYQLRLFGPLGIGAVQLEGRPGQVTLIDNRGKPYQAISPEKLLQQITGWQLPVSNLVYWIRGLPAPVSTQQGWQIHSVKGPSGLPTSLVLTHGPIIVRLVIDTWIAYCAK